MPNYYERDNGIWYINGETTKVKCSYSGSLEVAFQMGREYERNLNEITLQNRTTQMDKVESK